jgi:hypothetical protein
MTMKKNKLLILLLIIWAPAVGLVAGGDCYAATVAYIVGDTSSLGADTLFVQRLEEELGYTVELMDDDDVCGYPSWSEDFAGIIISDLALSTNVGCLKDTAVGIFTMDRYTEYEFGFGNTYYRPSGHGRRLVNNDNVDFVCGTFLDTIFPYQYDNKYLYYYGDLAPDAVVPFNTPDFVGHDSACVIILDKNAELAGGDSAVERRAFCGVFREPGSMDYCHSWGLFDRLVTWVCRDTANVRLYEHCCWGGYLEIDACWGELTSGQNDSATYNSEFRFGFDYDEIISFWRLAAPEKKYNADYKCDSLVLLFPIFHLGFNGTPDDSVMDIRIEAFRIIKSEKWHGPPPNSGGDPYVLDSTWVTRWDVVSGSSPVQWDTLDLRAGVDYNASVLDTFHLEYPSDSIGDTIRFVIAGSVFDIWAADTADNNGLVLKVSEVYDSSSNIEYSTRPPYENAIAFPMTVRGWFSPQSQEEEIVGRNIIGGGIVDYKRRRIIE